MQLLAGQTSLEPRPHRESETGRRAVREPEHQQGDGSRFASEPARRTRGSQTLRLPETIETSCRLCIAMGNASIGATGAPIIRFCLVGSWAPDDLAV